VVVSSRAMGLQQTGKVSSRVGRAWVRKGFMYLTSKSAQILAIHAFSFGLLPSRLFEPPVLERRPLSALCPKAYKKLIFLVIIIQIYAYFSAKLNIFNNNTNQSLCLHACVPKQRRELCNKLQKLIQKCFLYLAQFKIIHAN